MAASSGASHVGNLESRAPKLMEANKVPGMIIALVRDANVVWTRGFGVKDRKSGDPVDHRTAFEAASMSKPVFAYVVMKAPEKGVLNLDTPLVKYTHQRIVEGDPRLNLVTARHILSHMSGLQDMRSEEKPLRFDSNRGEKWEYFGEGYFYLQSVLTGLTGQVNSGECSRFEAGFEACATDFDSYMKTNLLVPFGMDESGYLWTNTLARHVARPHDADGNPLPQQPGYSIPTSGPFTASGQGCRRLCRDTPPSRRTGLGI
jgi:CubicO group peptidase (beta-lactamase class C family)